MIPYKPLKRLLYLLLLIASIPCWWSCGNPRQLQYMQGEFDTAALSKVQYPDPIIQQNDLLNITVYSDNAVASGYYNLPVQAGTGNATGVGVSSSSTSTPVSSYLVDPTGNIQFPGLGTLHVEGLTKAQLYSLLQEKLKDKLQNPYFIIRWANYRITLVGEVNSPGQYVIPNERVSLLEALGLAGDLTVYGRRDNVLIIREINGQRTWHRLDLRKPDIVGSPYYYLQPNDVVYVDLTKNKAASADATTVRNISLATSIISVVAILIGIFR